MTLEDAKKIRENAIVQYAPGRFIAAIFKLGFKNRELGFYFNPVDIPLSILDKYGTRMYLFSVLSRDQFNRSEALERQKATLQKNRETLNTTLVKE